MKLSREAIEEFKAIYKEEFGEVLTDIEAQDKGYSLLRLFKIIYRPLPDKQPKEGASDPN